MSRISLSPFTFPVWWYSEGLSMAFRHTKARLGNVLRGTGFLIFIRNMFQPLYGDYTKSGRAISFFIRIFLLIFLIGWTALRVAWVVIGFLFHIVALPLAVIMVIYQLFPS